ncbi:hypothetical protein [Actinomadura geliboluensis]|uniref:hypothetical protein n=1 Tax=Actinomadura geliboluensis TaxID=882440 RepID=UPI0036737D4F
MEDADEFRSQSQERLNALAELKYEVSRLSRQLGSLRALVDGPTLRAFLDPPQRDGMVAGESPSTGTVAPHETPTAAGPR